MQRAYEGTSLTHIAREWPVSQDLQRVEQGEATLGEAFGILARRREEQAYRAADLLEREVWTVTAIIARSEASWDLLARPTLQFVSRDAVPDHLEVGRYAHLAALTDPSPEEQVLIAAPTPCWARVYPHQVRQAAGQIGALARSYVPITTAEAVAKLGMGTIVAAIESAVRTAGSELRAETEHLNRRQDRLVGVERMLGWDDHLSDVPMDRATMARTWLALLLLSQGGRTGRMLCAIFVGLLATLLCVLFNPVLACIALPSTCAGVLIWERSRVS